MAFSQLLDLVVERTVRRTVSKLHLELMTPLVVNDEGVNLIVKANRAHVSEDLGFVPVDHGLTTTANQMNRSLHHLIKKKEWPFQIEESNFEMDRMRLFEVRQFARTLSKDPRTLLNTQREIPIFGPKEESAEDSGDTSVIREEMEEESLNRILKRRKVSSMSEDSGSDPSPRSPRTPPPSSSATAEAAQDSEVEVVEERAPPARHPLQIHDSRKQSCPKRKAALMNFVRGQREIKKQRGVLDYKEKKNIEQYKRERESFNESEKDFVSSFDSPSLHPESQQLRLHVQVQEIDQDQEVEVKEEASGDHQGSPEKMEDSDQEEAPQFANFADLEPVDTEGVESEKRKNPLVEQDQIEVLQESMETAEPTPGPSARPPSPRPPPPSSLPIPSFLVPDQAKRGQELDADRQRRQVEEFQRSLDENLARLRREANLRPPSLRSSRRIPKPRDPSPPPAPPVIMRLNSGSIVRFPARRPLECMRNEDIEVTVRNPEATGSAAMRITRSVRRNTQLVKKVATRGSTPTHLHENFKDIYIESEAPLFKDSN